MIASEQDITTFHTPLGAYRSLVLPFGPAGGPATFQRFGNLVLRNRLARAAEIYVDDIIIHSEDEGDHDDHVREVLQDLRDNELYVDIDKCEFDTGEVDFLGFHITTKGVVTQEAKIDAIANWQPLKDVTGIRSFLGTTNQYRGFIEKYSVIAGLLTRLTGERMYLGVGTKNRTRLRP